MGITNIRNELEEAIIDLTGIAEDYDDESATLVFDLLDSSEYGFPETDEEFYANPGQYVGTDEEKVTRLQKELREDFHADVQEALKPVIEEISSYFDGNYEFPFDALVNIYRSPERDLYEGMYLDSPTTETYGDYVISTLELIRNEIEREWIT